MTMVDVEEDVIPLTSIKRGSFLGLYISFPLGYRGKKYNLLLSTFRNNSTHSKQKTKSLKT